MRHFSLARDIYAEQLLPLGHGYPLWDPSFDPRSGEVLLGDVGFIHCGSFIRLFNATLPADDKANCWGVPNQHDMFKYDPDNPSHLRRRECYIPAGPIWSKSLRQTDKRTESKLTLTNIISNPCNKAGAWLWIKESATEEVLLHPDLDEYIKRNWRSWVAFVRDELELLVDIVFVRGHVKTADWFVQAFVPCGSTWQHHWWKLPLPPRITTLWRQHNSSPHCPWWHLAMDCDEIICAGVADSNEDVVSEASLPAETAPLCGEAIPSVLDSEETLVGESEEGSLRGTEIDSSAISNTANSYEEEVKRDQCIFIQCIRPSRQPWVSCLSL